MKSLRIRQLYDDYDGHGKNRLQCKKRRRRSTQSDPSNSDKGDAPTSLQAYMAHTKTKIVFGAGLRVGNSTKMNLHGARGLEVQIMGGPQGCKDGMSVVTTTRRPKGIYLTPALSQTRPAAFVSTVQLLQVQARDF